MATQIFALTIARPRDPDAWRRCEEHAWKQADTSEPEPPPQLSELGRTLRERGFWTRVLLRWLADRADGTAEEFSVRFELSHGAALCVFKAAEESHQIERSRLIPCKPWRWGGKVGARYEVQAYRVRRAP